MAADWTPGDVRNCGLVKNDNKSEFSEFIQYHNTQRKQINRGQYCKKNPDINPGQHNFIFRKLCVDQVSGLPPTGCSACFMQNPVYDRLPVKWQ